MRRRPGPAAIAAAVCSSTIMFALSATQAQAHIRWFTDVPDDRFGGLGYPVDALSAAITAGVLAFAFFAWRVHRTGNSAGLGARLQRLADGLRYYDWRIGVLGMSGLLLIYNALSGDFLAENLAAAGPLTWIGTGLQALLGVLLVFQITCVLPGILILVVTAALPVFLAIGWLPVPAPDLLDYFFELLALGAALILIGPMLCALDRRYTPAALRVGDDDRAMQRAIFILRLGVGLTLIVLAIRNKLLDPALSLTFLEQHDFNFMRLMGFESFSNLHFAYAAGILELTFGLLILFGIATRFSVACLSFFFVLTLFLLGPRELVGHAPIIGIAVIFILRGGGRWGGSEARLASPLRKTNGR